MPEKFLFVRDRKHALKQKYHSINNEIFRKKRKFELARPPAMTKLAPQRIHTLRTRGGNKKYRALRFVRMLWHH